VGFAVSRDQRTNGNCSVNGLLRRGRLIAFAAALKGRLTESVLFRNSLWFFGGSGVRLVLQAVYFLLIARALGVEQYGAFIGAVSVAALVAPFSSLGTGFILIKNVARDRANFARYWGAAMILTVFGGAILVCLVLLVSLGIWSNSLPLGVLFLVGASDIILVRVLELSAQAFTAVEVLRKNSELYVVLSVARTLAAVVASAAIHPPTALSWAVLYALSALVATIYSVLTVIRTFGMPNLRLRLSGSEYKEGFYFAVSQASQTIYGDIDKTMLVRIGGLGATGIYGAAYRIVDVSFAPVGAVVYAAFPRFFRHGKDGISGSTRFARRLIPYAAGYGAFAAVCLYITSPVLPVLLGKGFAPAVLALRWLSPLVLIKSIHYFLADSLTGASFQGTRTCVQLAVAVINVLLNLWLIPAYSWRGAAWASIASDGALLLGLAAVIGVVRRRPVLPCVAAEVTM
jgi:O-antigen/teichoic acid export membrane protein